MSGAGGRLGLLLGALAVAVVACSSSDASPGSAAFMQLQGTSWMELARTGIPQGGVCRRVHDLGGVSASRVPRRCQMVALAEAGDALPTRKRKEVPKHVQSILQEDSMAENVLEGIPSMQDFVPTRKVSREDEKPKAKPVFIKTELYVRGLPWLMDNDGLKELFKLHKPRSARVMKDKLGKKPLGFGFVTFYNEFKAAEAMAAMDGFAIKNDKGVETRLSISYATEKKEPVKNRVLSTRSDQLKTRDAIMQRKAELTARDIGNVVTSIDDMPRRFRQLADQNPEMIRQLQEVVSRAERPAAGRMNDDEVMDMEDAEDRARRLVADFQEKGNKIEDISDRRLRQERDAEEDEEVESMLYGAEEDDDEDWVFVPDGDGKGDDDEDDEDDEDVVYGDLSEALGFREETEEEKTAWQEYKRKNMQG